jgi:hypothetical protein
MKKEMTTKKKTRKREEEAKGRRRLPRIRWLDGGRKVTRFAPWMLLQICRCSSCLLFNYICLLYIFR